jgi:hypothetical protein
LLIGRGSDAGDGLGGAAMTNGDEARRTAETVEVRCTELSAEMRAAVKRVGDPRGEALLETAAEVVDGLAKAMRHYRQKSEPAWRDEARDA